MPDQRQLSGVERFSAGVSGSATGMTIPFLPFPKNGGRLPSGATSTALTPPEHPARRNAAIAAFPAVNRANGCQHNGVKRSML
jgi:hypothetical protein